jgi:hypothetical protein
MLAQLYAEPISSGQSLFLWGAFTSKPSGFPAFQPLAFNSRDFAALSRFPEERRLASRRSSLFGAIIV